MKGRYSHGAWGLALLFNILPPVIGPAFAQPDRAQTDRVQPDRAQTDRDAIPYRTISGELTGADHRHYRDVPFDVPRGARRLSVIFTYTGRQERTTIDLGLADPKRFRGWSGGSRDRFTLSTEEATPGYLPGPLPAGRWRLILGVPNIRQGAHAHYEARIFIERRPEPTAFAAAPLNPVPGWYRGDLHSHSANSDGTCLSQAGIRRPCPVYRTIDAAARRGLDFIALTDHNTTAHYAALRALQPAFDRLLLVPGREITTFFGHANAFGPTDFLDFRTSAPTAAATAKWMKAVTAEGGIVSVNHPGAPSGEDCMGCGWEISGLRVGAFQAVEVVNGGTLEKTGLAEGPLQGFAFWYRRLNAGDHVTAIGGSDNHDAGKPLDQRGAIGSPTTVIHMRELSLSGLIDGIRAGRVFIDVDGSKGHMLDLSADAGPAHVAMGETLKLDRGGTARFNVTVGGVRKGTVDVIVDGQVMPALGMAISGRPQSPGFSWASDGARHWIRVDVRDEGGRLILIGNPIYIAALHRERMR